MKKQKLSIYLLNNQLKNMWIPIFLYNFFLQIILVREIRNYAIWKFYIVLLICYIFVFITSNVTIELENKWENVNFLWCEKLIINYPKKLTWTTFKPSKPTLIAINSKIIIASFVLQWSTHLRTLVFTGKFSQQILRVTNKHHTKSRQNRSSKMFSLRLYLY